jgi:uncharacterized protein YjbI with pentapeptide repeats
MTKYGLTQYLPSNIGEFDRTIHFSPKTKFVFKEKNISNMHLTGHMEKTHRVNRANIISSFIDNLLATEVDFNNSDIKDSRFIGSEFTNCNFNNASHNNNWIKDSRFSECTFNQTSVTLSDFSGCSFINCDFSNVIISDSRFISCTFISCTTSNKMIESSLLFDCGFQSMTLESETILSNFGLSKAHLLKCKIRDENATLPPKKAVLNILRNETNTIQRFKLEYFLSPEIIREVSEKLESLFNVEDWLDLCRNPNRFRLHIEKLHEFLLYQFDGNNLRLRTLVQLLNTSSALSDAISKMENLVDLQRTVDGVFLTIERIVEQYMNRAQALLLKFEEDGYCRILVEGPLDKTYYEFELKELLKVSPVRLGKIIKHNSPNELFIYWENIKDLWPVILFVLSTKFKFELNKLDKVNLNTRSISKIKRGNQILEFESGFLDNSNNFSFRLKTLLPGHKELNLIMQLSVDRYRKIMQIVKDIIVFDKTITDKK